MEQDKFDTLLNFFKVLANENRLKILGILANRECSVEELATLLDLKASTVSHHLSKLKAFGLVDMRVVGNDHLHRLNADGLMAMNREMFFTPQQIGSIVDDDVEYEAWEKKVLRTFMEGDQIQSIASGYKKWLVLLKWVANRFEMGRRYTEQEVNEIIQRHHPDYALFRREMVDNGLMERENGIYWRIEWQMPEL